MHRHRQLARLGASVGIATIGDVDIDIDAAGLEVCRVAAAVAARLAFADGALASTDLDPGPLRLEAWRSPERHTCGVVASG